MIDVRTPIEKARDERNKRICNSFLKLSNEMPDCRPHVGMTIPGVKKIIIDNGLYQCKSNK